MYKKITTIFLLFISLFAFSVNAQNIKNNSTKVCSNMSGDREKESECYLNLAKKTNNIKFCYNIRTLITRKDCLVLLDNTNKNKDNCIKMTTNEGLYRDQCYNVIKK